MKNFVYFCLFVFVCSCSRADITLTSAERTQVERLFNPYNGGYIPDQKYNALFQAFSDEQLDYYFTLLAKELSKSEDDYWYKDNNSGNKVVLKAIDRYARKEHLKRFYNFTNAELNIFIHKFEYEIIGYAISDAGPGRGLFDTDFESRQRCPTKTDYSSYEPVQVELTYGERYQEYLEEVRKLHQRQR